MLACTKELGVDEETALVDLPWLAVETVELLKARGFKFIEIDYSERDTLACNVLAPQALWLRRVRARPAALFVIALIVNIGMWLERYMIIVSLHRDFLPSSWGMYAGTVWDWATFIGTIGLFLFLLFLFIRFLPMISIFEMRTLLPEAEVKEPMHEEQPCP